MIWYGMRYRRSGSRPVSRRRALLLLVVLMLLARGESMTWGQQEPLPGPSVEAREEDGAAARANVIEPPWARRQSSREPAGTADLLQLYGVTGADLARFADPSAPSPQRELILLRTLFHLPRFTAAEWDAWRTSGPTLEQVAASPDAFRGSALHVSGTCRHMIVRAVAEQQAEQLEFRKYFELEITTPDPALAVRAYVRQIPQAWSEGALAEPVALDGVLLDRTAESDATTLVVAAPRVAWHPQKAEPSRGIGPAQAALGQHAVDLGRFDLARQRNMLDFDNNERELFYQILNAVGQLDTAQLPGAEPLPLAELLSEPTAYQGQLLRFTAHARRVTPVLVDDPDIRDRYQIDRYYQVDALIQLDDRQIRLASPLTRKSAVYADKFPVTFCTRSLPESLRRRAQAPGALAGEQPLINERVELTGYFFKLWPYRSDFLQAVDLQQDHPSPLFLGSAVVPAPLAAPARDTPLGIGLAVAFAVALLASVGFAWRANRRQLARLRSRRRSSGPPPM